MQRVRRLTAFWNWLPAFRVVAETEHLPTAAKELNVTAPALSRSIKLLEQALGRQLFRRTGRSLELTEAGARLLDSLRDGMRRIDDGIDELEDTGLRGPVLVLTSGLVTTYLVDAMRDLRRVHPELEPTLVSEPPDSAAERLLRGELDLALHSVPMQVPRLTTEHLGEATSGVYCGPGHPLYQRDNILRSELSKHDFVGPTPSPDEGWPPDLPRRVVVRVSHMQLGCDLCAQGNLLATLPDIVAHGYGGGGVLRRLPFELIAPTQLFATYRPALSTPGRAEAILEVLRPRLRGADGV